MSFFDDIGKAVKGGGKGPIPNPINIQQEVAKQVAKSLPDEIKNLPKEVVQEMVGKVLVPLVAEILKPVEKVTFRAAAKGIRAIVKEGDMLVRGHYSPAQNVVKKAEKFYGEAYSRADADSTSHWGRLLWAFGKKPSGVALHPNTPMTIEEAEEQQKVWNGWAPFVAELKLVASPQGLIDDLNKISVYVDVRSNVTPGFYFKNPYTRGNALADNLDKWADRGVPSHRAGIRQFITDLGPDAMDITASASFQLGFIAGAGAGLWGIPTRIAIHFLDEIMQELGIPE